MKRLICEMCGSADLVKQDGVFVCQRCGCKYSVEEAKKMMIEGTVDVSGSSVIIDKSEEINNLIVIARRARAEGNYERAMSHYDDILKSDPNNWEANFYRSYCSTMQSKIINLDSSYETTVKTAVSTINILFATEPINYNACTEIIDKIKELTSLVFLNKYNIYNKNPEYIETLSSGSTFTHNKGAYQKLQQECSVISLTEMTLINVIPKSSKANASICRACSNAMSRLKSDIQSLPGSPYARKFGYRKYEEALSNFHSTLLSVVSENQNTIDRELKKHEEQESAIRQAEAEKLAQEQKERNDAYWAEHEEEKKVLENNVLRLNAEIKIIDDSIHPLEDKKSAAENKKYQKVPSQQDQDKIFAQRKELRYELSKMGIFSGKKKKELQSKIDELSITIENLNKRVDQEKKELREQIDAEIHQLQKDMAPLMEKKKELLSELARYKEELEKDR